jgi:hypothetical protein
VHQHLTCKEQVPTPHIQNNRTWYEPAARWHIPAQEHAASFNSGPSFLQYKEVANPQSAALMTQQQQV